MAKGLVHLFITALALLAVSHFVPGIRVDSFTTALLVAFLLAILNLVIRPIIAILTLPINVLTLGLFTFVLNGLLLWSVTYFVPQFVVADARAAILGALAVSILSWLGNVIVHEA